MKNLFKRDNDIWSSIRATPAIFIYYILLNSIINTDFNNVFFCVIYFIIFIINKLLKLSFKNIYKYFKTDYIPFIGQGSRPIKCTNCATFLRLDNPIAKSFGMPSGHSQTAWFFSMYIILNILENSNISNFSDLFKLENLYLYKFIWLKVLFFITLALVIGFSRIYVEKCHTLGQVFIGSIIGIILAIIAFYIKKILVVKYNFNDL